jgi:hypothetical protein
MKFMFILRIFILIIFCYSLTFSQATEIKKIDTIKNEEFEKPIEPAKKADIVRLLKAMKTVETAQLIINYEINHVKNFLPTLSDTVLNELKNGINPDELMDYNAPIFDKYFDRNEIKELVTFYESQVGIKLQGLYPILAQEIDKYEGKWMEKIHNGVVEKLKSKGLLKIEDIQAMTPQEQPNQSVEPFPDEKSEQPNEPATEQKSEEKSGNKYEPGKK